MNPHIGPLTKVIPLKVFLDIVPSSSAEIARALRRRLCEGSVYSDCKSEGSVPSDCKRL